MMLNIFTACVVFIGLILAGCGFASYGKFLHRHHFESDPLLNPKHYREEIYKKEPKKSRPQLVGSENLHLAKMINLPQKPSSQDKKLISITITNDIPLKDVLMEIGRMAHVDVDVADNIDVKISFHAYRKPLSEVLSRICDMANLTYKIENDTYIIKKDMPYMESYNVDFLNLKRTSTSGQNISTSITGGTATSGGTTFSLATTGSDTFWEDVTANINQIIATYADPTLIAANALGAAAPAAPLGAAAPAAPLGAGGFVTINRRAGLVTVVATKKAHAKIAEYLLKLRKKASAQVLIEIKIVEVKLYDSFAAGINWDLSMFNGLITFKTPPIVTNTEDKDGITTVGFGGSLSGLPANPISGLIGTSVAASAASSTSGSSPSTDSASGTTAVSATPNATPTPATTDKFSVFMTLLGKFGTTNVLSNPRMNAINNEPAVMAFTESVVYFDVKVSTQSSISNSSGSATLAPSFPVYSVTSTPQSVPIGIVVNVQPSIDLDKREIMLNVRPVITDVLSYQIDPGLAYLNSLNKVTSGADQPQNKVPVMATRELDAVLKIKDGDTMFIGGFTKRKRAMQENGIPGLRRVPFLGWFAKNKTKTDEVSETVILIKATIIDNPELDPFDKKLYNKFVNDPRNYDN